MDDRDIIRIKTKKHSEYSTKIEEDDKTYYIVTELLDHAPPIVKSTVYLDGAHIETDRITLGSGSAEDLEKIITEHHGTTVEKIKKRGLTSKKRVKYFRDIKRLIKHGKTREAMEITLKALKDFPDDPYGLSYYGLLLAETGDDTLRGIQLCRDAIEKLDKSVPFGSDFFYPFFYLNLGRAYLLNGRKEEAVKALRKGLSYDSENREVISELRRLGVRRKPLFPFLRRSNPINKYMGLLITRLRRREVS